MSLSRHLQDLNIASLSSMPKGATSCIVLGKSEKSIDAKELFYLSPIEPDAQEFIKYEVGSEEGVLALLLEYFATKDDQRLKDFLSEQDTGYISAESSVGEEEIEELSCRFANEKTYLYICKDLEFHKNAYNIACLISMLNSFSDLTPVYEGLSEDIKGDEVKIAQNIEELESFDGAVVYFTNEGERFLFGSAQFAMANKIQNKDKILVKSKLGEFEREFCLDKNLKGTVALLEANAQDTYSYEVAKISRISS